MIDLISAATLCDNNNERVKAEGTIIQMRLQRSQQFFLQVSQVLLNQQILSPIRQSAGTLLSVSILCQTPNGSLWDMLTPFSKQKIKESILSVFIDKDRNVRRAAANCVSAICQIELPRQEWPDIIQTISSNTTNQNHSIKQISLITIGFICERIKDKSDFHLNMGCQENILGAIATGLQTTTHQQIIEISLKALRDSINSLNQLFLKQKYLDFIFMKVNQLISNNIFVQLCLQIWTQFAKSNYNYLCNYIALIFQLTEKFMSNSKDQKICINAMQFWQSIACEYKNRSDEGQNCVNYISSDNGQKIVIKLLQNLCVIYNNEEQQNDIISSAGKCLQSIFEIDSSPYQKIILNFTANTIKHTDWKYRQAGIKAFAILLIGLPEQRSQELVNLSLEELLLLLNDQSKIVQYSALCSMTLITQQCGICFLKHKNFLQILKLIVSKLKQSEKFLSNVCHIINNLTQICQQQKLNNFYQISDDLISLLLISYLAQQSSLHTINCLTITILNLIHLSHQQSLAIKYIEFVLTHFHQLDKINGQKKNLYSSSFFALLHTCIISLRKSHNIPENMLSNVYQLVLKYFNDINDVDSDGLYIVSALSFFFRKDERLMYDFWQYIEHALKKYTEEQLFKSAISCVSDFAACYGLKMKNKINIIFDIVFNAFQSTEIQRQAKVSILTCFGEIMLNCGIICLNYLQNIMNLLFICCDASVTLFTTDFNYSQMLKDSIIETFVCIVHGLCEENNPSGELKQFLPNIFKFIQVTTDKNYHPKLQYVKNCVLLMGDISNFYKVQVFNYVRQPFASQCIQILNKYNKNGQLTKVINYARSKF